jgi:hypothetical protein
MNTDESHSDERRQSFNIKLVAAVSLQWASTSACFGAGEKTEVRLRFLRTIIPD